MSVFTKYVDCVWIFHPNIWQPKSWFHHYSKSWPWSYDSWSYDYLCNQCLSPLMLWVRISIRARCTTLCDKVCRWFSPGSILVLFNILKKCKIENLYFCYNMIIVQIQRFSIHHMFVCLMVFNATFNNISVISWRSILLVEETREPGENHRQKIKIFNFTFF
jgi:hypothetical protein